MPRKTDLQTTLARRRILISLFVILTIAFGLFIADVWIPPVSEPHAVAIGLGTALRGYVELSGAQAFPTNIRADLVNAAEEATRLNSSPFAGRTSEVIWRVSLDGVWFAGGYISTEFSRTHPLHHLFVYVDSNTGSIVSVGGAP